MHRRTLGTMVALAALSGCARPAPEVPPPAPVATAPAAAPEVCDVVEPDLAALAFHVAPHRDPAGAVAETCAALRAASQARLADRMPAGWRTRDAEIREDNAEIEDPDDRQETLEEDLAMVRDGFGRCHAAGEGAWLLEATRAGFDEDEADEGAYRIDAVVAYVDASGAVRRAGEVEAVFLSPFAPTATTASSATSSCARSSTSTATVASRPSSRSRRRSAGWVATPASSRC